MKTNKFIIIFAILLMSLVAGCQQTEPFFFIQMSDPQFGHHTDNKGFSRETELFEKAIAQANQLQPEFVIITGDLVHQAGNDAQARELLRIADKLNSKIALYWVAGNHDVKYEPTDKTLSWYRHHFGKDWYSFDVGRRHFVVVNCCIIEHPENVAGQFSQQEKWLRDDLAKACAQKKPILLFMHYPLLPDDSNTSRSHFRLDPQRRADYFKLFGDNGVQAIFAGHLHYNLYDKADNTEIIVTGTVAGRALALGKDSHGFRIVKVYADRMEHKYYRLDNMPVNIQLTP